MKTLSIILSCICIFLGSMVSIGWIYDIDVLKEVVPGMVTMKITTAICFIFGGALGIFANIKENFDFIKIVTSISCYSLMIFMGTQLFIPDSGMESLFVQEHEAILSSAPGVPSISTMIAFILCSIFGLFCIISHNNEYNIKKIVSFSTLLIGCIGILGYIFGVPMMYFYIPGKSTAMALHTTVGFILLSTSYLTSRHCLKYESYIPNRKK